MGDSTLKCMRRKKAESILDFTLAFVVAVFLLIGIARIWVWFNVRFAERQVNYEKDRFKIAEPQYQDEQGCATCKSKFSDLRIDDKWLFEGKPSGNIKANELPEGDPRRIADACKDSCTSDPLCWEVDAETGERYFNEDCHCYSKCVCLAYATYIANRLRQQADYQRVQANKFIDKAKRIHDNAKKCCKDYCDSHHHNWCCKHRTCITVGGVRICIRLCPGWAGCECYFGIAIPAGSFISTCVRLANNLACYGQYLRQNADELDKQAEETIACCDLPTVNEQQLCIAQMDEWNSIGDSTAPNATAFNVDAIADGSANWWEIVDIDSLIGDVLNWNMFSEETEYCKDGRYNCSQYCRIYSCCGLIWRGDKTGCKQIDQD